jgi:hypothetical protein
VTFVNRFLEYSVDCWSSLASSAEGLVTTPKSADVSIESTVVVNGTLKATVEKFEFS